ncbi:neurofilament light polypeptide [Brachionichthys hirsutus]|uniref:neurofilament light polypeptide n=1 Tax=Brachionichthys hirsutus TaxID=412623 RepID=UPI00360508C1
MSYSSEMYGSSSYRKIFGDAPRSGRVALGRSSSPPRLQPAGYRNIHRTYGSPSAMSPAAYRRTAAPGRVFSSVPDSVMDLTQSTAVTNELKIIRTNEKEQLQGLNDRFVSFIEKVHGLEQQNKVLEAEVMMLRQRNNEPSRLHGLYEQEVSVEMDMSKPDLTAALKDIRAQYENLSARNQAQAEEWYHSKFTSVTEAAARNQDVIKHSKEELIECRRQVQARTLELEALRGHNEALERQIAEMEDRHSNEIGEMQDTIQQLEAALRNTKGEMSHHLREYQDLLNVKMALDIEIAAYRKLLEGEECRLSSVGGAMIQSGYPGFSYMSARSYTLGAYRKSGAKPEEEEEEAEEEEEEEEEEGEEEGEGEEEEEEEEEVKQAEKEEKEEKKKEQQKEEEEVQKLVNKKFLVEDRCNGSLLQQKERGKTKTNAKFIQSFSELKLQQTIWDRARPGRKKEETML